MEPALRGQPDRRRTGESTSTAAAATRSVVHEFGGPTSAATTGAKQMARTAAYPDRTGPVTAPPSDPRSVLARGTR